MKSFSKIIFSALALAASAPASSFACAACYGRSDSPLASGMNWGIFTLLGIVVSVLTCIAAFFVHIVRKEAAANHDDALKNPSEV